MFWQMSRKRVMNTPESNLLPPLKKRAVTFQHDMPKRETRARVGRRARLLLSFGVIGALALLTSCGGSGSDSGAGKSAPTYVVGGTLAGLASRTLLLSSRLDSARSVVTDDVTHRIKAGDGSLDVNRPTPINWGVYP